MEKIFSNDSDISRYKTDFENRKEAHRIQELKDNQKVKVLKAYAFNDGYYYVFRKATTVIQNCTNQVLKNATIVVLQFDNNGYPVNADYSMYAESGASNSVRIGADSINVQPGGTWGSNRNASIADDATRVKACVKSAEFYDGTTWHNPYYDHWLETEKDRY